MKRRNFLLSLPLIGLAARTLASLKPKEPVGGLIENANNDGVVIVFNPSPPSWVKQYAQVKTRDYDEIWRTHPLTEEECYNGKNVECLKIDEVGLWPTRGTLEWENGIRFGKVIFKEK